MITVETIAQEVRDSIIGGAPYLTGRLVRNSIQPLNYIASNTIELIVKDTTTAPYASILNESQWIKKREPTTKKGWERRKKYGTRKGFGEKYHNRNFMWLDKNVRIAVDRVAKLAGGYVEK